MKRRDLPPLSALRAFEAAARHESFSLAAEELRLTQSAISHQISALEDRLGFSLFDRVSRRVALSDAGRLYYPHIRDAFDRMQQGTELLLRSKQANELRVQVYVTVAVRWLIPRLHYFQTDHPDIVVRFNTSAFEWEFDPEIADVGMICAARPDQPGVHYQHLFEAKLWPVCAPAVAHAGMGLRQPVDLVNHTLLQVYTAADDWKVWLEAAGISELSTRMATHYDSYLLAIQGALDGLGVAIAPHFLVAEDIRLGRLVRPFSLEVQQPAQWYLACLAERAQEKPIQVFGDWLTRQVAKDPLFGPTPQPIAAE